MGRELSALSQKDACLPGAVICFRPGHPWAQCPSKSPFSGCCSDTTSLCPHRHWMIKGNRKGTNLRGSFRAHSLLSNTSWEQWDGYWKKPQAAYRNAVSGHACQSDQFSYFLGCVSGKHPSLDRVVTSKWWHNAQLKSVSILSENHLA